jgi:ketosteroid isomerase-like protein
MSGAAKKDELLAVVDAYIDAYNASDFERLGELFADDLRFQHHNRGFALDSGPAFVALLEQFGAIFASRGYVEVRRRDVTESGRVVVESVWEATAAEPVPDFAEAGETKRLEYCTIMKIRDGQIVEFDDYG